MYLLSTVLFILVKSNKEKRFLDDNHIFQPFYFLPSFSSFQLLYLYFGLMCLPFISLAFPKKFNLLLLLNHLPNHGSLVYVVSVNTVERVHFI